MSKKRIFILMISSVLCSLTPALGMDGENLDKLINTPPVEIKLKEKEEIVEFWKDREVTPGRTRHKTGRNKQNDKSKTTISFGRSRSNTLPYNKPYSHKKKNKGDF